MQDVDQRAEGNIEVIDALKKWLTTAEEGKINAVAIVGTSHTGRMGMEYSGVIGKEADVYFGMERLKLSLMQSILDRQLPPQVDGKSQLTADYAVYNRGVSPHCFDFLFWLINSEMVRVREGAPAPLKVCFVGTPPNENAYIKGMYYNVMKPMVDLIGAVEDPRALNGWNHTDFAVGRPTVEMFLKGTPVPKFKPTPEAARAVADTFKTPYVTITLREAEHWPHRNSNMEAWLKIADYLKEKGLRVIFIRDTAKADEPLPGYETYPFASKDIDIRMAVYTQADANIGVANGPSTLCFFTDKPLLNFVTMQEEGTYAPGTTKWWHDNNAIGPGEQYPWFSDKQRFVWADDNFENIKTAWETIIDG